MLVQPYHLDLPANWDTAALRYLANVETGSGDAQDANPDGQFPFIVRSPTPMASVGFTYDTEAVLTAGDGNVGEIFHHIKGKFHAHQRVYVLSGFRRVTPRYFYYFFSSHFRHMAKGGEARTTVDSVRRWMITDMPFAVPPIDEQRAIADYLDWETQKIDDLITEQRGLIETLRERRQAVIDQAVSGMTSQNRPSQKTEFEWLGQIPVTWEVRPLWSMFERVKDVGHPNEEMLSVFREFGVVRKDSRENLNVTAENRNIYQLVGDGWFVVNRMKAWQGSVGISPLRGIVSGHYICFKPRHSVSNGFLNWLFRSPRYRAGYQKLSRGVRPGQAEIDNDTLRVLPVLVPPPDEQSEIVEYLNEQTSRIDELISESEGLIALSQERRAALITAAVTGQIDVRTAA